MQEARDFHLKVQEWMDARGAATHLGLPLSTIRRLTRAGEIPHKRFTPRNIRYSRAALDEWASGQVVGGA